MRNLLDLVEYEKRVDEFISTYLDGRPELQSYPRAHQLLKLAIAVYAPGLGRDFRTHLITSSAGEMLRAVFPDVSAFPVPLGREAEPEVISEGNN